MGLIRLVALACAALAVAPSAWALTAEESLAQHILLAASKMAPAEGAAKGRILAECPGNLTAVLSAISVDALSEEQADACGDFIDVVVAGDKSCPKKLCDCVVPAAAYFADSNSGECVKTFDGVMDEAACAADIDVCLNPPEKKKKKKLSKKAVKKLCKKQKSKSKCKKEKSYCKYKKKKCAPK